VRAAAAGAHPIMPVAAVAPALLPALVLCGYLIVAPNLRFFPRLDVYDEHRLLELVALVVACLASALRARAGRAVASAPSRVWYAAAAFVVACGVASSVRAAYPREALLEVILLVTLASMTAACAATAAAEPLAFRRCVGAALLASAALAIVVFIANLFGAASAGDALTSARMFPGFTSPRFLGQWQTWTLVVMSLPLTDRRLTSRPLRALVAAIAVGWWMLAFAAGTRATLLGIGVGLAVTALLVRPRPRRWLVQQVALAAGGAATFVAVYVAATGGLQGLGTSVAHLGTTDDSGRLALWRAAVDLIRRAPWLGVGPSHYGYYSGAPSAHPHDAWLQLASEWGLPAALTVLACAAAAARVWYGRVRPTPAGDAETATVRAALTATLVAVTLHAALSGVLVMPISQIAGVLVLGWAWGEGSAPRYESVARHSALPAAAWFLACVLGLLIAAGPDLADLGASHRAMLSQTHFRPRIWKEGASNFSLTRTEEGRLPSAPR
jgi:O-antigen ligase